MAYSIPIQPSSSQESAKLLSPSIQKASCARLTLAHGATMPPSMNSGTVSEAMYFCAQAIDSRSRGKSLPVGIVGYFFLSPVYTQLLTQVTMP